MGSDRLGLIVSKRETLHFLANESYQEHITYRFGVKDRSPDNTIKDPHNAYKQTNIEDQRSI